MRVLLELQHVTRTQKASFATTEPGNPVDHVEVAWDTWLDMGKPLTVVLDLTVAEKSEVSPERHALSYGDHPDSTLRR